MNYEKLNEFYISFQAALKKQKLKFMLVGGHAAIHYKLAEFTKDYDISVDEKNCSTLIDILDALSNEEQKFTYRVGLGAPLVQKWGSFGWTSHFEVIKVDLKPRIDVFVTLPRVDPRILLNPIESELNILAETKKTQREKDWDFVKSFGIEMLNLKNYNGFLHIFDSVLLKELTQQGMEIPNSVIELRPNLKLLKSAPKKLEAAFAVEKLFWQKWDYFRLKAYLTTAKKYLSVVRNNLNLTALNIKQQHVELLKLAEQYLPPNPYEVEPIINIINRIKDEISDSYSPEFLKYLPNLDLIVHENGVYNPIIC